MAFHGYQVYMSHETNLLPKYHILQKDKIKGTLALSASLYVKIFFSEKTQKTFVFHCIENIGSTGTILLGGMSYKATAQISGHPKIVAKRP